MSTGSVPNPSLRAPALANGRGVRRFLPALTWLAHYRREDLPGDLLAGVVVAIMLAPQGMAYALLAGLPPQAGLYASILPLILYGLLGSSRVLSVGPVAIVSLMVTTTISPMAPVGSPEYWQLALTLAFLAGLVQLLMGVARLGFMVNFLSQPVLSGFTSAAAIVIGLSQVKHLLGIALPRTDYLYQQIWLILQRAPKGNWSTMALTAGALAILLFFRGPLGRRLRLWGATNWLITPLTKSAPLVVVLLGTGIVAGLGLHERAGVSIVGVIPQGLPPLTLPSWDLGIWSQLLPGVLAIAFVGYMQSVSAAKALASRRRQKLDSDQELVALGVADLAAAFTGGYPVTGGLSRSVVNFSAGANTGLASILSALLLGLTVLFLTPLFYYLPNAVLAAIIVVAISNLFDGKTLFQLWRYSKSDSAAWLVTFGAVLALGVEAGILVGVAVSLILLIWRTTNPHVAVVGRLGQSESYRNVLRHPVQTWPGLVAVRIDESLYFANTQALESAILRQVVDKPEVKHLVLIGSAVNFIDASALETLESLIHELGELGVEFHLSDIKGPVMDRLQRIGFVQKIGAERIHLSIHDAVQALGYLS